MKPPAIPRLLAAGLCLFLHGHVLAGAYVDEQNRLVINGQIITPPEIFIDISGNISVDGHVFEIPNATILEDGSLLLEGVIYPVPPLPFAGAASFEEWLAVVFPDPADRDNPELAGPMADPGNRGLPNLIRYALAMHSPDEIFDRMPRGAVTDGRVSLSFPFIGIRTDVRVEVVASSDLTDWSEVLWDSVIDGPAAAPGTWVRVEDVAPLDAAGDRRFLRLRVSQPPAD